MKSLQILLVASVVALFLTAGCGAVDGDSDVVQDIAVGQDTSGLPDTSGGDVLQPPDITGIDTAVPEVAVSEEQALAYQRHAELIVESADMTYEELFDRWFDRGEYLEQMPFEASTADFMGQIASAYAIDDEAAVLLNANGFAVLDNGSSATHPQLYMDIYVRDLPVFITADSIMYAVHKSYDEMLKQLEENALAATLGDILAKTAFGLTKVCQGASGDVLDACGDIDIYLTVARTLLGGFPVEGLYPATAAARDEILAGVAALQPDQIQMFGRPYPCGLCRYDFSQFKPRGHYNDSELLQRYFRSMIWLGRTPMNLTLYDRDLLASVVLLKALVDGGAMDLWQKLDHAIVVFVGTSDNLTPTGFVQVIEDLALNTDLATLPAGAEYVRGVLAAYGVPGSRILSQIMMMDVMSSEPTPIPAEFQLLGQRFVIDSYVFSNVVYDRITWQDTKPQRYMPDPLDVAFVLGYDQALPLLEDEIGTWNYGGNLNVLRTMVSEYDTGFWTESMYNAWLGGLAELAADQTGAAYPAAARTRAWALRSMQAGLASWAELRHDTILYVKQSYTGESCEYPDGYVEPNPGFFDAMKTFAVKSKEMLSTVQFDQNQYAVNRANYWFDNLIYACDNLAAIAGAQLDGTPRTPEQTEFIKSTVVNDGMCGGPGFSGWYADLFYDAQTETFNFKPTVADVHTDPNSTDVLHVATGGANPMVVVVELPGGPRAFVGPVSSYYQFRESGFGRLTDAEWLERYLAAGGFMPRPDWADRFVTRVEPTAPRNYCE